MHKLNVCAVQVSNFRFFFYEASENMVIKDKWHK